MSTVYLSFDTETGSLKPTQGDLLTAYFCILDENFKILEELSLQLKPEGRLPVAEPGALAVNGINIQKHIEDPNTIVYSEGAKKITALAKKYLKKRGRYSNIIPTGYNVDFDVKWIKHHLMSEDAWDALIHYKSLDVMHDVDMLKRHGWLPPTVGNLKSVVEHFGVPKGEAHIARDDVIMTIEVYKKIKALMDSKKSGGATQDLIALLEQE